MDQDYLALTFGDSFDGTFDVDASVSSEGFAGHGRGYFNRTDIEDFAAHLVKQSHSLEGVSDLSMGYSFPGGQPEYLLFSLKVTALDHSGHFAVRVELADHDHDAVANGVSLASRVTAVLRTSAGEVEAFAQSVRRAMAGESSKVVLRCS